MATAEGKAGKQIVADGGQNPARLDRTGGLVVANGRGRYGEATSRQDIFSMVLAATTSTIAAGNIVAAAAAAATQFALFNPVSSGVNFELLEFGCGVISGTPPGGPVFHGVFASVPTLAASGTTRNNYINGRSSSAIGYTSAAGAALTGGPAPTNFKVADFSTTATAQASVGMVKAVENIDGKIVLPPGTGWVPLHSGAGTTCLHGYSVTWQEVAI